MAAQNFVVELSTALERIDLLQQTLPALQATLSKVIQNVKLVQRKRRFPKREDIDPHDIDWYLDVIPKQAAGPSKQTEAVESGSDVYEISPPPLPPPSPTPPPPPSPRSHPPPDGDASPADSDGLDSLSELFSPALSTHSLNFTAPPNATRSSPVADTPSPGPPLNTRLQVTSNPSSKPSASSARAVQSDNATVYPCDCCPENFPDVSQLVDHIESSHAQGRRLRCKTCNKGFGLKKDLRRHFDSAKQHQFSVVRCRCEKSLRKDKLYSHLKRKRPCDSLVPFLCYCGLLVNNKGPTSTSEIIQHIRNCGRRRPGRPKK